MVYFKKSQPAPKSLESEKIKRSGDCNQPDVVQQLEQDFKNKCYICEQKEPISINIEHFKSHHQGKYIDLKFDWNNLFFACSHCNNVKSTKFDNLLNCTVLSDNVDTALHYEVITFPKKKANFRILINSDKAIESIALLDKAFNGDHTAQKKIESSNLRKALTKEMGLFYDLILEYFGNNNKNTLLKIEEHLSNRSAFTAFKRWIVRDNSKHMKAFGKYI